MKFGRILKNGGSSRKQSMSDVPRTSAADEGTEIGNSGKEARQKRTVTEIPDFGEVKHMDKLPDRRKEKKSSEYHTRKISSGHLRIVEKGTEDLWPPHYMNSDRHDQQQDGTLESLPPLQATNEDEVNARGLAPLPESAVDPDSFDLAPPPDHEWERPTAFSLERRSLLMFSKSHLRVLFQDFRLLRKFTAFLVECRPQSVPLLVYHLEARKALAAIKYSNALGEMLGPVDGFAASQSPVPPTRNGELIRRAESSFEILANEDLPAWITAVWMRAVEVSIKRRIIGSLPTQLRDMSEGLAETFVLSDPARHDNPILFASEEFNRMTQYGNDYILGKNCRIFQGPKSNPHGIRRLREKVNLNNPQQHYEPLLNYRRDGSAFMNLLMITPLLDADGKVRYFLGAQIDTSGLLKEFYGFEYLHQYMEKEEYPNDEEDHISPIYETPGLGKDEMTELSEMLNHDEIDVVRKNGGRLHLPDLQEPTVGKKRRLVLGADGSTGGGAPNRDDTAPWEGDDVNPGEIPPIMRSPRPSTGKFRRVLVANDGRDDDHDGEAAPAVFAFDDHHHPPVAAGSTKSDSNEASRAFVAAHGGQLGGVYDQYVLVRPAPHLRVLFASPSMREPGLVQSDFMDHVGGSPQLRRQVEEAFCRGQSVTARVRWLSGGPAPHPRRSNPAGAAPQSQNRWIHATPLLGRKGEIGVWMVVLVSDERDASSAVGLGMGHRQNTRTSSVAKRPQSTRSRSGSAFQGTDAGSMFSATDDGRDSGIDGLRPPPPPPPPPPLPMAPAQHQQQEQAQEQEQEQEQEQQQQQQQQQSRKHMSIFSV